jgi:HlyD family secretion protein
VDLADLGRTKPYSFIVCGEGQAFVSKWVRIVAVLVVMAGAVAFGVSRFRVQTKSKRAEIGRVVTAKTGDIAVKVSENGTLEPVTQVEVKSRVAGRVLRVYVKEGDLIKTGDLIATIDPTEVTREAQRINAQLAASRAGLLQAQENYEVTRRQNADAVRRAEQALREARARLTQASAPNRFQDVAQGSAQVARAEAQVADAKLNFERQQKLVDKGFVAQAQADSARTALRLAEADLLGAKQRVGLLQEGPRVEDIALAKQGVESARVALQVERNNADQAQLRLRDIERARAEVAQIQNQLAQQNVQLQETRIVAPTSGEVVGKFLNEGELVASATAGFAQGAVLVRIADLTKMRVRVNVNEVDVAKLRPGLPAEIRVDGVTGKTFAGHVAAISPSSLAERQATANSASTNTQAVVRFEVKVAVDVPDKRLRPGMTAGVDILLNRRKNVVLLSTEALRPQNKVAVVTGTGETATIALRTVQVGLKNDAQAEILSGLQDGDKVEVPKAEAKDRRKFNVTGPD